MHLRKHGTTYATIDHHVGFGGFATVDGTVPSGKFPVESLIVNMPFWEEVFSTDFVKPNLDLSTTSPTLSERRTFNLFRNRSFCSTLKLFLSQIIQMIPPNRSNRIVEHLL